MKIEIKALLKECGVKGNDLVDRLIAASSLEERLSIIKEVEAEMEPRLNALVEAAKRGRKTSYVGGNFAPRDAVNICFICKMADMEPYQIFKDWNELINSLMLVKGDWSTLATKLSNFLIRKGFEASMEELLKEVFKVS